MPGKYDDLGLPRLDEEEDPDRQDADIPEPPLPAGGSKYADLGQPRSTGPRQSKYADLGQKREPGSHIEAPIEEQGVSPYERLAIQNTGVSDAAAAEWLGRRGYEVAQNSEGRLLVRTRGEPWRPINPKGADWGDIGGIPADVGHIFAGGLGTAGGALLGAPTGPGAILTAAAGGAAGEAVATGAQKAAARLLGFRETPEEIGTQLAVNTALGGGFAGGGAALGIGARAAGRQLAKIPVGRIAQAAGAGTKEAVKALPQAAAEGAGKYVVGELGGGAAGIPGVGTLTGGWGFGSRLSKAFGKGARASWRATAPEAPPAAPLPGEVTGRAAVAATTPDLEEALARQRATGIPPPRPPTVEGASPPPSPTGAPPAATSPVVAAALERGIPEEALGPAAANAMETAARGEVPAAIDEYALHLALGSPARPEELAGLSPNGQKVLVDLISEARRRAGPLQRGEEFSVTWKRRTTSRAAGGGREGEIETRAYRVDPGFMTRAEVRGQVEAAGFSDDQLREMLREMQVSGTRLTRSRLGNQPQYWTPTPAGKTFRASAITKDLAGMNREELIEALSQAQPDFIRWGLGGVYNPERYKLQRVIDPIMSEPGLSLKGMSIEELATRAVERYKIPFETLQAAAKRVGNDPAALRAELERIVRSEGARQEGLQAWRSFGKDDLQELKIGGKTFSKDDLEKLGEDLYTADGTPIKPPGGFKPLLGPPEGRPPPGPPPPPSGKGPLRPGESEIFPRREGPPPPSTEPPPRPAPPGPGMSVPETPGGPSLAGFPSMRPPAPGEVPPGRPRATAPTSVPVEGESFSMSELRGEEIPPPPAAKAPRKLPGRVPEAVAVAADNAGVDPHELWSLARASFGEEPMDAYRYRLQEYREGAKAAGLNPSKINRLEDAYKDYSKIRGFDEAAAYMAERFGWNPEGANERLWDLIKNGPPKLPKQYDDRRLLELARLLPPKKGVPPMGPGEATGWGALEQLPPEERKLPGFPGPGNAPAAGIGGREKAITRLMGRLSERIKGQGPRELELPGRPAKEAAARAARDARLEADAAKIRAGHPMSKTEDWLAPGEAENYLGRSYEDVTPKEAGNRLRSLKVPLEPWKRVQSADAAAENLLREAKERGIKGVGVTDIYEIHGPDSVYRLKIGPDGKPEGVPQPIDPDLFNSILHGGHALNLEHLSQGEGAGGRAVAYHVTDEPGPLAEKLKSGVPTIHGGKVGIEKGPALYGSTVPESWVSRAKDRWGFVNKMTKDQKAALLSKVRADIENQRATKYITETEADYARGLLEDIQKQPGLLGSLLPELRGQPYNIDIWKPHYLEPLGITPGKQPETAKFTARGVIARLASNPNPEQIEALRASGIDGALTSGGFAGPEIAFFRNEPLMTMEHSGEEFLLPGGAEEVARARGRTVRRRPVGSLVEKLRKLREK